MTALTDSLEEPCASQESAPRGPTTTAALAAVARAAFELDRDTRALAAAHLALDRELARGLARVWQQDLFRPLGYARATDFAHEELGIKESKARQLARLGRALAAVPELEPALSSGRLHASKVPPLLRLLGSAAPADERRAWIERAVGCSVHELTARVRAEIERRNAANEGSTKGDPGNSGTPAPEVAAAAAPGDARASADPGNAPADAGVPVRDSICTAATQDTAPHIVSAAGLEAQLRPGLNLLDPDARDGDWISVAVPARTSELWALAVDAVRHAAGREAPLHQCAEWIAADYLARVGDEDPELTERHERDSRHEKCVAALARLMDRKPRRQSLLDLITASGLDYAFIPVSEDSDREMSVEERRPADPVPEPPLLLAPEEQVDTVTDPFELTAVLSRLVARKRRLRLELGQHLHRLELSRAWEHLGACSYDDYCTRRLGCSRRHAEYLSYFYRALRPLRRLRRAYLDGSLNYTATRALLRVIHPTTEALWLDWARGLAARHIERTVEHAALYMLPGAHPTVLRTYAQQRADSTNAFAAAPACNQRLAALPATNAFATAPTDPRSTPPLGWPLPPLSPRQPPRIRGLDLALAEFPDHPVARIRFWAPPDVLALFRRALRRCRAIFSATLPPTQPDAAPLEILLAHFLLDHDSPAARRHQRTHPILRRDRHRCAVPGCSSRDHLEVHHLWFRARGGTHHPWNLITLCRAHHALLHQGKIHIGGWAPWALIFRLGIHPTTGRALTSYANGRRVPDRQARRTLERWHAWCRRQHTAASTIIEKQVA